ncbi:MAG TPA: signal recognition particle-docking protein FtsY [Verrucomicrobiaceae bacterium]
MAGFFKRLVQRFTNPEIDWDDLEHQLISGDLGAKLAVQIVEDLRARQKTLHGIDIVEATKAHIREILPADPAPLRPADGKPKVLLVVGVNGTGKTTSTAKLAALLKKQGHRVMLAAADTFRAAAVEQLEIWSQWIDVPLIKGAQNADPGAVCFDACQSAAKRQMDFLLCDTAGRLHTRHNLMEELRKVQRVIAKTDATAPHEVLLVVDATTGGNALQQAREFHKAVPLTGLIVTKLDGSGKGGIVVSIYQDLGVPTRFVGTGEGAEDFKPFAADEFLEQMF